jgi:hypothetical protein
LYIVKLFRDLRNYSSSKISAAFILLCIDRSSNGIDANNLVHRYDHLYKSVVQVVEEGRKGGNQRYKFASPQSATQIFFSSLNVFSMLLCPTLKE